MVARRGRRAGEASRFSASSMRSDEIVTCGDDKPNSILYDGIRHQCGYSPLAHHGPLLRLSLHRSVEFDLG